MRKPENKFCLIGLFILFIFSFAASGCFDVKREIKLYPNGSGVEDLYFTLDADFYSKMETLAQIDAKGRWKKTLDSLKDNSLIENRITADVQRTSGTSIKILTITSNPDGSKGVHLQYIFDEPTVLTRLMKEFSFSFSNQLPVQFSVIKFIYDDEGNLTFKHTTRKAERYINDELLNSVFSTDYLSKRITYSIEFPFDVKESNAMITSGNILTWDMTFETAIHGQQTDTAALVKDPTLELPYAEKIDRTIGKVSEKENPLVRVQVYNRNKEPVKIGTGVVLKEVPVKRDGATGMATLLVTNFNLMNLIEGAGFFSIVRPDDSLAAIDDMFESDLDQKQDLCFLRFNSPFKFKQIKYASFSSAVYGDKIKIFYYPNTLSSIVYSMTGTVSGTKKWTSKTSVIEIKPAKPITLEGGAVFNDAGDFLGMLTTAFEGEVGKLYLIPAEYIKNNLP